MDKITKERIKELKSEQKYNEIFIRYGSDAYKKYAPYKHKRQDLKKLKKEGKYEAIFNKYGEKEYNKLLTKAMYKDIKQEVGGLKAFFWKTKKDIKNIAMSLGIYSSVALLTGAGVMAEHVKDMYKENAIKYESEIEAYNKKINNYATKINEMKLTDTQIFVKVMDDMWGSIQGYATPKREIAGFQELELADENGYGVCRNMASDVARKLNEINPEYNARIMMATIGEEGNYEVADIERNFIETNETVKNNEEQETTDIQEENVDDSDPNHVVTLVDVPRDNLTVVLDPTNPGIGIYENGKIIMFNSKGENGLKFEADEITNAIFSRGGVEGIIETSKDYIKSFGKSNLSFEEIEKKYGIEAQNKALAQVRAREKVEKIFEEQDKDENKEFKEKYKVDVPGLDIEQLEIGSQENIREIENDRELS